MRRITILLLLLFAIWPTGVGASTETTSPEIDLAVNPQKVLFDLSNVKPGDSVSRQFTITNSGEEDFNYILTNKYLSGSGKFYKQLDLRIENSSGVLYSGKISEFIELSPTLLESNQIDNLLFHIAIPIELGNEYQGLTTQFQFHLFVEGTLGGLLPVGGPKLPSTASNMFNYIVIGGIIFLIGAALLYANKQKLTKKSF